MPRRPTTSEARIAFTSGALRRGLRWTCVAGLLAAAIIVPFVLFGAELEQWFAESLASKENRTVLAWWGALVLALDVILPVPSSLVMTTMGVLADWKLAWLASFVGMSAGAVVGYLLGRVVGTRVVERLVGRAEAAMLARWMSRHGAWVLIACRPVPVLAEATTIVAGTTCLSPSRAAIACTIANAVVPLPYVILGSVADDGSLFLVAFGASLLLSGLLWFLGKRHTADHQRPHIDGTESK